MEEGYPEEELAEDRKINEKVLGDEECDAREEDLGSEGEFGLIEAACELLGSPTIEVQYNDTDQIQPVSAGSQGSNSTRGSRLPGVKFCP